MALPDACLAAEIVSIRVECGGRFATVMTRTDISQLPRYLVHVSAELEYACSEGLIV